jgi:penicillin-binding protein 1A
VVDGGTGSRLRFRYGLSGAIAGKTGTTNDNSDGWFIGYTPTITAGVWVGAEDRYVHFSSTALGQGANMALPIWGIWMKKVLADGTLGISSNDAFPEGTNVSFCRGDEGESSAKDKLEDYYFE